MLILHSRSPTPYFFFMAKCVAGNAYFVLRVFLPCFAMYLHVFAANRIRSQDHSSLHQTNSVTHIMIHDVKCIFQCHTWMLKYHLAMPFTRHSQHLQGFLPGATLRELCLVETPATSAVPGNQSWLPRKSPINIHKWRCIHGKIKDQRWILPLARLEYPRCSPQENDLKGQKHPKSTPNIVAWEWLGGPNDRNSWLLGSHLHGLSPTHRLRWMCVGNVSANHWRLPKG